MTLIIVAILLLAYLLIATERITNVNKAAVAVFAGTVGWVLYICYGTDYLMSQHQDDYLGWLDFGAKPTSVGAKTYIAQHVFLPHVGRAAEVVLFLLATMTIVEILDNNGCFDFVTRLLRTRHSRKMLWTLAGVTALLSANLDNLTTTVMMLTIMHRIIPGRRWRMVYGSTIVVAANCGGALTVIGDPAGQVLWMGGRVTATDYSLALAVPCLLACVVPIWWLGRQLPERIETEWITMPYRGDDTNLNTWQRLLMLFVGIGGLWFIPTFHNITKLSPFLGALCVLSVLWVVNEVFNRRLMNADQMTQRRTPRVLQYGTLQMMLFVMGMLLAVGVVQETGAFGWLSRQLAIYIREPWGYGLLAGLVSTVLDNVATAVSFFELQAMPVPHAASDAVATGGLYWKMTAYAAAIGGNVLCVGSMSGLALMKMERLHVGWYFRNLGWVAMVAGMAGLLFMWIFS